MYRNLNYNVLTMKNFFCFPSLTLLAKNLFGPNFSKFRLALLLIGLVTIASHLGYSQLETYPCDENEYLFTGVPEMTLCEQFPNFVCSQQIGVGTSITHSSQIGNYITGNVCIVGDFIIDNYFIFYDAVVKVNEGVKISTNGSSQLTIERSKLFACNGLWKGIVLGQATSIITKSSTIEDAEIAILAVLNNTLSIQRTIFNRNRIGIDALGEPSIAAPFFQLFRLNTFSCTAPLNGTINEITTAGVRIKNVALNTITGSQVGLNWFRDIIYGIYATGGLSIIATSGIVMERIKKDGIFMEEGLLTISNSSFTNCQEKESTSKRQKLSKFLV